MFKVGTNWFKGQIFKFLVISQMITYYFDTYPLPNLVRQIFAIEEQTCFFTSTTLSVFLFFLLITAPTYMTVFFGRALILDTLYWHTTHLASQMCEKRSRFAQWHLFESISLARFKQMEFSYKLFFKKAFKTHHH